MQIIDPNEKIYLEVNSPIPLYYQIQKIIEKKISGENHGKMLPTESQMMQIFGVSRATIRKALDLLEQSGHITRIRGKGTAIRQGTPMEEPLTYPRSFTEQMKSSGHTPVRKFVCLEKIVPDEMLRIKLKMEKNEMILKYSRLYGHEEIFPIVFFESYIPERLNIEIPHNFTGSLYELFEENDTKIVSGDAVIEARLANKKYAKLLNISIGDPVLYFERISYNRKNLPVEFVVGRYDAKNYKYIIKLG